MSKLKIVKYINDPIYGGIPITEIEQKLIDTPIFQRLRGLRQLARVNYVFPAAEHSRFAHSLGVLYIMGLMANHLFNKGDLTEDEVVLLRISALLHDIGHYPLSHLGETVYSYCQDNTTSKMILDSKSSKIDIKIHELASAHLDNKSAHHERLGKYIVTTNNDIKKILEENGINPLQVGEIFTGEYGTRNMVYTQLLHSSLDADRLDYLLRDSYQTGVKYGLVDLEYLIRLFMVVDLHEEKLSEGKKQLVCNKKGQHVVEHFLTSRYFHYSQIIFHKTNASFEGLIKVLYIKLIQANKFLYNSYDDIKNNVNNDSFLNFNDSFLEVALQKYYEETEDEDYKKLYTMYRDRIRPKVVFDMKDLYEDNPSTEFSTLKWLVKRNTEEITKILGTPLWGYQIVPISIEKIHNHNPLSKEDDNSKFETMREAIKMYDESKDKVSYLAEDNLSIISKLSFLKSEFIRIFVLDPDKTDEDYKRIKDAINLKIKS